MVIIYLRSVELLLDLVLEFSVVVSKVFVGLSSVVGDFDGHEEVVSLVVLHHDLRLEPPPVSGMTFLVRYPYLRHTVNIAPLCTY